MARPTKNNAEYFSHDSTMRNDIKVKALRRRFSHMGYAVWCFILETLTDTDFFELTFDDVNQELLAADFDISVDDLNEIIGYCQKIGLLQISPDNKIYSEAHKKRFGQLIERRAKFSESGKKGMQKRWGTNKEVTTNDKEVTTNDKEVITDDNIVKESKVKESKVKEYPYQDICDLWNSICISLPKVMKLTERRKQKIKCRLDELGVQPEQWLETAENLFKRVQASDFLTGRSANKQNWAASFDWFFENPSNWVKVSEGNYDNKAGRNAQTTTVPSAGGLGVGEYIDASGRRTYGSGKATIPNDAPPRPSDRYSWSAETQTWIML